MPARADGVCCATDERRGGLGRQKGDGGGPTVELLVFEVADVRLALPVSLVREILRAVAITPLATAPPVVDGVINARGSIIPVLDIRKRLSLPAAGVTPDQHFILANTRARSVALRVGRAIALVAVDADTIVSAPSVSFGADCVAGIATLPDGLLVIHDLERFLSPEEDSALSLALAAAPAPVPARSDNRKP